MHFLSEGHNLNTEDRSGNIYRFTTVSALALETMFENNVWNREFESCELLKRVEPSFEAFIKHLAGQRNCSRLGRYQLPPSRHQLWKAEPRSPYIFHNHFEHTLNSKTNIFHRYKNWCACGLTDNISIKMCDRFQNLIMVCAFTLAVPLHLMSSSKTKRY